MKNGEKYLRIFAILLGTALCLPLFSACGKGQNSRTEGESSPLSESSLGESSSLLPETTGSEDQNSSSSDITTTESEESKVPAEIVTESIPLNFTETACIATALDPSGKEGGQVSYTAWLSTDYIDVSRFSALRYELAAHKCLQTVAFFDENRQYISGVSTDSICGFSVMRGYTEVPEKGVYARFINFTGSGEYRDPLEEPWAEGLVGEESLAEYKRTLKYDGMKIVCIGDSLTEGDQGSNTAGVPNKNYHSYPFYLARILDCRTINQGRCGITPSGTISLYNGSGNHFGVADADVVLIMLGTNGGLDMNNRPTERRAYQQLINAVTKEMKPGCRIILMTPPHATTIPGKVNYGYAPWVENATAAVKALAEKNDLSLIDVYGQSPITEEMESVYQPNDGLHLSSKGYEALAQFIAQQLEKILAE